METLKNSTRTIMTSNQRRWYNQTIITYDTESTSLFKYKDAPDTWRPYIDGKSDDLIDVAAVTWAHMWCIDGRFVMARTMDEAREVFRQIGAADPDNYKIVWVHNLKYDFAAAILNIFDDLEVFARTARDVMIARSDEYKIEFRCSYKLLNASLANAAKTLKIKTQKGDLDYTLFRSPETPLTDDEVDYCRRDVVALWEIMKVYKKEYRSVEKIPHTSTGIIRKDVQHKCDPLLYKRTAAALPDTVQKFLLQTSAFYGGYTHANAARVNEYIPNVFQYDLASAYPAAMLFEDYPAGDMWNVEPELWEKQKDEPDFLWIGRFVFTNVEAKGYNSFLSYSRLWNRGLWRDDKYVFGLDNGRIRSAPVVDTFFTSVDYKIFIENYDFENVTCIEWCQGRRGKLENSFRRYVLSLYEKKTKLKGVDDDEYRRAKNNINGLFGMAVTNTIRAEVVFDPKTKEWDRHELTEKESYDKLMKMKKRRKTALPFSTGVFIPAYVRAWVWEMIHYIDLDVIYCDTDSVKFVGDHHALFEKFNARVFEKHAQCATDLGVPLSALSPADPKGILHPIGIFAREDDAEWFVTLGAKRYAETVDGETWCTISGVRKQKLPSIRDFYDGRFFDEQTSGKTIACYIEGQQPFSFTDHTGRAAAVDQPYAVNIRPTTYKLSTNPDFMKFVTSTKLSIFEEDLPDETEILQSFSD